MHKRDIYVSNNKNYIPTHFNLIGMKFLFFIVLSIITLSCADKPKRELKEEAKAFSDEHSKDLLRVANWLDRKNIDTNYVVEFRSKAMKTFFFYVGPNGENGSYFQMKDQVPDSLINLFEKMNLSEVIKRKEQRYYRFKLGNLFYNKAEAWAFVRGIEHVNLNTFHYLEDKYNRIDDEKWLLISNHDVVFVSQALSDSLTSDHKK